MPAQSRRPASRPSRAQRRGGVQSARTYNVPTTRPMTPAAPRRVYMPEPAPIDYTTEYGYIRKDLRRIFMWAGLILLVMIALAFVV